MSKFVVGYRLAMDEADGVVDGRDVQRPNLHHFLSELRSEGIHFDLDTHTPDAVSVAVTLPRERWEIDFYADGRIEGDRFIADGDPGKPLRDFWITAARFAEDG